MSKEDPSMVITIRFPVKEYEALEKRASLEYRTVAGFIRSVVLRSLKSGAAQGKAG